jgi:tRNA(adenine34) deaminase
MSDHADQMWMREALVEAELARAKREVPVGCVIVSEGAAIGRGHNLRESEHDPTAHAEMIAIREAARAIGDFRLVDATAYVTLEPCVMCAGAFVHARIPRVVYGCTDPKGGAVHTLFSIGRDARLNHVFACEAGVLAEESAALLRAFFESLRAEGKK